VAAISSWVSTSVGVGQQALDDGGHGLVDTATHGDRVGAGGHVAQTLANQGLGEDGRGGRTVTGDVVGLLGDLLDELGADLLVGVLELDLLGDGDTVVGDGRGAPLLVEHDVAALGAEGDLDGVSEGVQTPLHAAAGLLVKSNDLGHVGSSTWVGRSTGARDGRIEMARSCHAPPRPSPDDLVCSLRLPSWRPGPGLSLGSPEC